MRLLVRSARHFDEELMTRRPAANDQGYDIEPRGGDQWDCLRRKGLWLGPAPGEKGNEGKDANEGTQDHKGSTSTASGPLRPLATRARKAWSGARSERPPRLTVSI